MGRRIVCFLVLAAVAGAACAELQNVQVGGEMRMRYRYYRNTFTDQNPGLPGFRREIRIPNAFLPKRPIGPRGVSSIFDWDDKGNDWQFFETAVLLNVKADFTNNVGAFIELYDFHVWGEDFRSNWITGADARAATNEDVEINQAYIDANEMFGMPLRLRIGRQALKFGRGWLVSDMLTPTQRLSFDAIRLTYDVDAFTVDAFAAKLAENGVVEEDGDTDFYGIYGTYKAFKPLQVSAYWFWLRDAQSRNDTNFIWLVEWMEDLFGVDDYDVTNLHTVGLRLFGETSGFDYDLELAYQFGNADFYGPGLAPIGLRYGPTDAEFDNWAAELNAGYTFDMKWSPRVLVLACYFQGHDNRDISFWDWLNPFYKPEASVSFNRLFSDINHMPVVNDNGWLSNVAQAGIGFELQPTEKVRVHFHVAKDWIVEPFDFPVTLNLGKFRIPIAPALSFWTRQGSDDLGWEAALWIKYNYSEDLSFLLYYNRLFVGKGLTEGGFIQFNGTDFCGGTDDDDADYVFLMSVLRF